MSSFNEPLEIQDRLRKRYLDRLADRIKRMRKELVQRNWQVLRTECRQLKGSGDTFGFHELTVLASRAEQAIPESGASKAVVIPAAKQALDSLIAEMDAILTANSGGPGKWS